MKAEENDGINTPKKREPPRLEVSASDDGIVNIGIVRETLSHSYYDSISPATARDLAKRLLWAAQVAEDAARARAKTA